MADIDGKSSVARPGSAGRPPSRTAFLIAGIGVLIVALVGAAVVLLGQGDPPVDDDTDPPAMVDAPDAAVWPWESSDLRFQDPVEAARSFATDYVGFTDPVVGAFAQGDSRSGEVEVRPRANGPVTTVLVRQGGDDSWWVIGSATEGITLDEPEVLDEIRSPVRVRGSALVFEGTVLVHVREDGRREPIGTGVVTGGGGKAEPFEGSIEFSRPRASTGAIVLLTESADDGQPWQATVVSVRFVSRKG